ncbi:2OG-Fe(II) oxygenase [Actinophytocola xanthii]|nr:2OG-Fe(II) oxygenase [Actinophytocola xanthii]
MDSFLPSGELTALRGHLGGHASHFEASRIGGDRSDPGRVAPDVRRSRVLYRVGEEADGFLSKVRASVPTAVARLGIRPLPIATIQLQATATNDGEFFRPHTDNRHPQTMRRWLAFTFFLHHEPPRFSGGELRIAATEADGGWSTITPTANRIVFFPTGILHEIAVVRCPSGAFEDCRLTLNGWVTR